MHSEDSSSETLILKIADLARGGAGVGRDNQGRVVFVKFTAPGDTVRVRIVKEDKRYAEGKLVEILEPSPLRITPKCPVFGKCGGCEWQHLPYDVQWKTKVSGVRHALSRVSIESIPPIDEIPADQIWEYRNRVQLRGFKNEIGFYASGTNQLVPTSRCEIARPEINARWESVRLKGEKLPRPYKVEIEILPDGKVRETWNSRHAAGGFRQVHDAQNERLQARVADLIQERGVLLDLYGGSGNLSLPLATRMKAIHCVDISVPKTPPSGTPFNLYFHRSEVGPWLLGAECLEAFSQDSDNEDRPISVILDPPRDGLGREFAQIVQGLENFKVREAILVGCDPDSWARDVSRFTKKGWVLDAVSVLDLFPQTHHIESIARLARNEFGK